MPDVSTEGSPMVSCINGHAGNKGHATGKTGNMGTYMYGGKMMRSI